MINVINSYKYLCNFVRKENVFTIHLKQNNIQHRTLVEG